MVLVRKPKLEPRERVPSSCAERGIVPNIAITAAINLGNPVIGARPRNPVAAGAIATVRPTAMHENHGAADRKHWQRLHVQPMPAA
jgi:hypothetical protein